MGYVPVEQTVAIIEAVKTNPEPEPNKWAWMAVIAVLPVVVGWWLGRKK